jgi:hypothetical protein
MCSYVQPLGPVADPLGTAFSTAARISSVIVVGGSSVVGTGPYDSTAIHQHYAMANSSLKL